MTGLRTPQRARPGKPTGPTPSAVVVLLGVELMLIGLSICAAVLEQSALAIMAGTAAITLAGEIVRRYLMPLGGATSEIADRAEPDQQPDVSAPPPGAVG